MSKYKLVVLTSPSEGQEAEYNNWYTNIHIPEVLQIGGFKSAQRYKLKTPLGDHETFPYLAIYEIEANDINQVLAEMGKMREENKMTMSDAVSPKNYVTIYEDFGPAIKA